MLDRNLYDGHKAVAHLENKLVGKLLLLQMKNLPAGPSFEKLQVLHQHHSRVITGTYRFGESGKSTILNRFSIHELN